MRRYPTLSAPKHRLAPKGLGIAVPAGPLLRLAGTVYTGEGLVPKLAIPPCALFRWPSPTLTRRPGGRPADRPRSTDALGAPGGGSPYLRATGLRRHTRRRHHPAGPRV